MRKLLFLLLLASTLAHPDVPAPDEVIDAVEVAPAQFAVLFENEHVRVIRYSVMPGERDTWHTHPSKVSVVTSGGSLRVTLASGDSFVINEENGSAAWMQPLGPHYVENIGAAPVQIILVEVKSAPAGPFVTPKED